jgi:transcription elongation factor GreA
VKGYTANGIFRAIGLVADGPVVWGSPVRSGKPGLYVVELVAPLPRAPVDASFVGRWIERVPTLTLDGHRPAGKELMARLAAFWLADQTVLYAGMTAGSIGGRVAALYATPLGDPRPHAGGHWLRALRGLEDTRIWWAETNAPEEYLDAFLGAFAEGVSEETSAALHDPTVVVPFANLQTPTGLRRDHGIEGALLPGVRPEGAGQPTGAGKGGTRSAAEGSRSGAQRPRSTTGRSPRAPRASSETAALGRPTPESTYLSSDGIAAHEAELRELTETQRPEVIARIRAARELGDLSENADYEAARKEQSLLEGRIQTIEQMLRNVVVVEATTGGEHVVLGSTVTVEIDGRTRTYAIVGPAEAQPREGRLSFISPIGKALLGRGVGDDVVVQAPRGDVHYRIREIH